jgi:hypothetical protein
LNPGIVGRFLAFGACFLELDLQYPSVILNPLHLLAISKHEFERARAVDQKLAESQLIELLQGKQATDFTLTISVRAGHWQISCGSRGGTTTGPW